MLSEITDPFNPNYGCFPTDWGCLASEAMARTMASTIKNFGDFTADMITNAFNNPIGGASWDVAHGQFLFWIAVMTPVILIIALIQIGIAMIVQNWQRIARTTIGAVLAVPFSAICVWGMQKFAGVTDSVTSDITATLQGGALSDSLLRVMGIVNLAQNEATSVITQSQLTKTGVPYVLMTAGASGAQSIGNYVLALMVVGLMAVASLFLFIAMSLRAFGLIALAAMAPVGLMMIGQPKLGAWAQRWISLATGLLMAKPLAAGVLLLAVQLTAETPNIGYVLICAGAVFAAAFSPLWATKLVSFAGAEVGSALHNRISVRNQVARASTAAAPVRAATRAVKVAK